MPLSAPPFDAWLEDFFVSYYYYRPVNATFIGEHAHDYRLPDFSENGAGDRLADMGRLLRRLDALPDEPLTRSQEIDRTLAKGFLRIQSWESNSVHFHRGNPSTYTGEAVFSIIGLFLTNYAPVNERTAAAIARMQQIPTLLAQGEAIIRQAPVSWTERALRECQGAQRLLGDGINQLMAEKEIDDHHFRAAADQAGAAFSRFETYLRNDLLANDADHYACGEAAFDMLIREGHCLNLTAEEILNYAAEQWAEAQGALAAHAADFDAVTPEEALAGLADLHPAADKYYATVYGTLASVLCHGARAAAVDLARFPHRICAAPAVGA